MTQTPFQFVAEEIEANIRKKIGAAIKADLLPVERYVLNRLISSQAFGADHAISIHSLLILADHEVLRLTDRSVKQAIKTLIEVNGLPIGSCRVAPHNGYAFIVTDEQAEAAVRPLKSEIFSMFRRIKVLAPRSAFVRKLQGQLEILMEGE